MNRAVPILLLAFLATSLAGTGYALSTSSFFGFKFPSINPSIGLTSAFSVHEGITGKANIANVSPLCSVSGSEPATGPALVVTSSNGKTLIVPLNWSLVDRCALVSQFEILLQPGTYDVTLSPCNYLGCNTLPISVTVHSEIFTTVNVNIVTGIY